MPRVKQDFTYFTVRLPKDVVEQLDAIAEERGTKRGVLMREAAYLWLKQLDQPKRRAS